MIGRMEAQSDSEDNRVDRSKLTRSLLVIFALGLICLQVFRWQNYAFEATWLSLKSSLSQLGLVDLGFEDHLRFGTICNSIEAYKCSEREFNKALDLRPRHLASLGNLAIARSHLRDKDLALKTFDRYFEAGGLAYDVMYFYAHLLFEMKMDDKALEWLYRSLSVHTSNQVVANELVDQLTLLERYYEALSLTGALAEVDPGARDFWLIKYESLVHFLESEEAKQTDSIRIPSLDGKNFYVPVRSDNSTAWSLFVVDRTEPEIVISEELLSKWSYATLEKLKNEHNDSKKQQKFVLERLKVGPWQLENVEAVLCSQCQPRLGRTIMNYLSLEKGQDQIMNYIMLKAAQEEE